MKILFALLIGLQLSAYAEDICQKDLNKEYPQAGEKDTDPHIRDSFANLSMRMKRVMLTLAQKEADSATKNNGDTYIYGKGSDTLQPGDLRRAFHAKAHGCVRAEFRVDYDLSKIGSKIGQFGNDLGVFNKKDDRLTTYDAWVRFSNARGSKQSDLEDDLRGLAIKLLNIEGSRVRSRVNDERDTQDFLLTNAPVHFAKDASEMVRFAEFMLNPVSNFLKNLIAFNFENISNALKASKDIKENRTASLLTARYYSRTPFMVGQKAAKFSVTPAPCDWWHEGMDLTPHSYLNEPNGGSQPELSKSEKAVAFNWLREDLIKKLSPTDGSDVCFDFNIQFQVDACKQPVEEADIEWLRKEAPVYRVAQLRIPKQIFTGEFGAPNDQDKMCEEMRFNPWHALEAHRPIGHMNRARETVYYEVQKTRSPR